MKLHSKSKIIKNLKEFSNLINNFRLKNNDCEIRYEDINLFNNDKKQKRKQVKKDNDKNNKIREFIIFNIISKKVCHKIYKISNSWRDMKNEIERYLQELFNDDKFEIDGDNYIIIEIKGGRKYNYDFLIKYKEAEYKVEFKFNSDSISKLPQFVQIHKPSKFLTSNYEEFYYDKYLPELLEDTKIEIPEKELYLKDINSPDPKCVKILKEEYKNNKKFKEKANKYSKISIKKFIDNNDLKEEEISKYLLESQNDKYYMFYYNGKFKIENLDSKKLEIKNKTQTKTKNSYIVETISGLKLNFLLRWKNNNGIAYPALQVKVLNEKKKKIIIKILYQNRKIRLKKMMKKILKKLFLV